MWNEEACTLTVEGEDVFEDVVLDVADHAAYWSAGCPNNVLNSASRLTSCNRTYLASWKSPSSGNR